MSISCWNLQKHIFLNKFVNLFILISLNLIFCWIDRNCSLNLIGDSFFSNLLLKKYISNYSWLSSTPISRFLLFNCSAQQLGQLFFICDSEWSNPNQLWNQTCLNADNVQAFKRSRLLSNVITNSILNSVDKAKDFGF